MSIPYRLTPPLGRAEMAAVRRRAIFECCKWDPQVEDVSTLAAECLVLDGAAWDWLRRAAEALARETLAAEAALVSRPELHWRLGLSRGVRGALRVAARRTPVGAARVMRFDFHFTSDGWRLSEVNSDVPGGFIEGAGLCSLMNEAHGIGQVTGSPADAYALAVAAACTEECVAMVHATAYSDDAQVMEYLMRRFRALGLRPIAVSPDQIEWSAGRASIDHVDGRRHVGFIVRFFPGEWLPNLRPRQSWQNYFWNEATSVSNPATALLTQSKRLPLVWDDLGVALDHWRALLPETVDPRRAERAGSQDEWVIKPALGRVGDGIRIAGVTPDKTARQIAAWARWRPAQWVAQRRFHILPVDGTQCAMYPCIGVFVIDGRAAGIYGRMSSSQVIDHLAQDVAVVVAASTPADHHATERCNA